MREDRMKWNKRYRKAGPSVAPARLVKDYFSLAPPGEALDIAAGRGQNALFLAQQSFRVEAVDISDQALAPLAGRLPNLRTVCADLDTYEIPAAHYSLILDIRFLSRRLFPLILGGLKPGGLLIFEGILAEEGGAASRHPEYRLAPNELLRAFGQLRIVYYRETVGRREGREHALAALVGIKPEAGCAGSY